MKRIANDHFKGHQVELYQLDNSYMVRIDNKTDLEHQAFAFTIDKIEKIVYSLLSQLEVRS